jgi:hypothetical protein
VTRAHEMTRKKRKTKDIDEAAADLIAKWKEILRATTVIHKKRTVSPNTKPSPSRKRP